jgi:hypothetical protein
MEFKSNTNLPPRGSDKNFGLVFAAVFLIVGLLPLFSHHEIHLWSLIVSALFTCLAYIRPSILTPLNKLWFRFGLILHGIIGPIVLFVMYCIAIVPIGLYLRIAGKDPLKLKSDANATSYWIERTPPGRPDDSMKNQF